MAPDDQPPPFAALAASSARSRPGRRPGPGARARSGEATLLGCVAFSLALASAAHAQPERSGPGPVPVTGFDHVGVNVPDADQAVAFFAETFAMKVVSDMRPVDPPADWKSRFRWHAGSRIVRIVMVETPDHSRIELFQYDAPAASRTQPQEDDVGETHIALRTPDIDASVGELRSRGVPVLNDPATLPDGTRFAYMLTPWGGQIELIQAPPGTAGAALR